MAFRNNPSPATLSPNTLSAHLQGNESPGAAGAVMSGVFGHQGNAFTATPPSTPLEIPNKIERLQKATEQLCISLDSLLVRLEPVLAHPHQGSTGETDQSQSVPCLTQLGDALDNMRARIEYAQRVVVALQESLQV